MTALKRPHATYALAGAVLAGVAMSFGQTVAPHWLASLFNSAAPVVTVAALVALTGWCWRSSTILGALAGPAVLLGYYVTSTLRGFSTSPSWLLVWVGGGLVFGAVMGFAIWTLRSSGPTLLRGLAAAVWPGIAIGEALHGLVRIGDTTSPAYWIVQAALGAGVLIWLLLTRVTGVVPRLVSAGATAVLAGILYVIMGVF